MATLHQGILGGFSGKVGNVVGYYYKGQWRIRKSPAPCSKAPTSKQLLHRQRFGIATHLAAALRHQLESIKSSSKRYYSAHNRFVAHTITNAFVGNTVDYSKLQLTSGNLAQGFCQMLHVETGPPIISWCERGEFLEKPAFAIVNAYSPELDRWASLTEPVDQSCHVSLDLPCEMFQFKSHVYLYFRSADGKRVSSSVYLGEMMPDPDYFSCEP